MCGICGYISKSNVEKNELDKMTDCLSHRGPDDRGTYVIKDRNGYNIGLGHRRLSILDCTLNGHQPMSDFTGRYSIVFNGEIYNYREIANKLKDYTFVSSSDTEVLLYSYIKYREKCLELLNGMFSFAIYDRDENTLFMARDRIGKKPLYYYVQDNHFVFSSELKSIIKFPYFIKELNQESLVGYFSQNCILPPNTIFKNVFKLCAGDYLMWKNGEYTINHYYKPIDLFFENRERLETNYSICKNKLKSLLYDAVDKRLVSDVPVGTLLSGGIDSTLITAIAADIRSKKGIDSFSIGFNDEKYDESYFASQTARYLGTNHHEKIMSENDLLEMVNDMSLFYDEPFSDSSQIPTMLVSKFCREQVTVALSGDGGDELFAGYTNIDTITKIKKYDLFLSCLRKVVPSGCIKKIPYDKYRILLEDKIGIEKVQYYAKLRESLSKDILIDNKSKGTINNKEIEKIDNWIQKRMLIDLTTYLPDEILTKTDRASMRYSLEMRCPILDTRIVDYSMQIPIEYKYYKREKKHILKDVLYDLVPKEMVNRPKKGFGIPIRKWLKTELNNRMNKYLDYEYIVNQGIFIPEKIKSLYSSFLKYEENSITQIIWSYFVFQDWYETYMRE